MRIGNREIGINHPPYVIAEIGVNHDGDVNRALSLTDAAAEAGADAIKLQFFETDRLMSKAAKLAAYQKNAGETDPIEMLRRLELTIDEMARVVERAHCKNIHAIVTVFSTELVEIAETLPWDAYKTASPDIVNKPLLEALMHTGKPMIVSTGASDETEIRSARKWLDDALPNLAFLHCISCYPTANQDAQIGMCRGVMLYTSPCTVGYSDHTTHIATGKLAIGAGARILEKHFTDDRARQGPDHLASLEAEEFSRYVKRAHSEQLVSKEELGEQLWIQMWGEVHKRVLDCEQDVRTVSRQSVVTTTDIPANTTITRDMLTIKRPGTGILACNLESVIGCTTSQPIEADVPIQETDLVQFEPALASV
jgi:N,N'-diacetyllegionaminate synthase